MNTALGQPAAIKTKEDQDGVGPKLTSVGRDALLAYYGCMVTTNKNTQPNLSGP